MLLRYLALSLRQRRHLKDPARLHYPSMPSGTPTNTLLGHGGIQRVAVALGARCAGSFRPSLSPWFSSRHAARQYVICAYVTFWQLSVRITLKRQYDGFADGGSLGQCQQRGQSLAMGSLRKADCETKRPGEVEGC